MIDFTFFSYECKECGTEDTTRAVTAQGLLHAYPLVMERRQKWMEVQTRDRGRRCRQETGMRRCILETG